MASVFVPWAEIKNFADDKGISIQYVELGNKYLLHAFDGVFSLESQVKKTSPANADQTDFETNYQANANKAVTSNVIRRLGKDSVSLSPLGMKFTGVAATTTTHDKLLTSDTGQMALRGGFLYIQNAVFTLGDSLGASIIDKDDVLGFGATPQNPITVAEYIKNHEWMVMPNVVNELIDESISDSMPSGLYFRLSYKSDAAATTNPEGVINIIAYEI